DHHFDRRHVANFEQQIFDELRGLSLQHVHLPVSSDDFFSHNNIMVIPGRSRGIPPRNRKSNSLGDPSTLPRNDVVYCLSVSSATPGNSFPSNNSSVAPPPVEMNVILSATPACLTAVTESPPPIIVIAFDRASARAIAKVPLAKSGISKTPSGPFHKIVFAIAISPSKSAIVSGPASRFCQSSGIPRSGVSRPNSRLGAPARTSCAIMAS